MINTLNVTSDGLLGGTSLAIATRGYLGYLSENIRLRKRYGGGGRPGKYVPSPSDYPQLSKSPVVIPYDEDIELLLFLSKI